MKFEFKKWLEMLSPVPIPTMSVSQRDKLGLLNAMPTGTAKVTKWRKGIRKENNWRPNGIN